MFTFQNDSIGVSLTETNFDELGLVSIERMGDHIPYYGFSSLPLEDEECNGSCADLITEHYDFKWI